MKQIVASQDATEIVTYGLSKDIVASNVYILYEDDKIKKIILTFKKRMDHTPIPDEELKVFKFLPEIRVVFDVGARADTDYLLIKPDIELHAFEPNPTFFNELEKKIDKGGNIYLNNFGLGNEEGNFKYSSSWQAFEAGENKNFTEGGGYVLPIKTLDNYVKEKNINGIDFLKIDTEGYDYKVLLGGKGALKITKYLQYEHWDNKQEFYDLLENNFEMYDIGDRNVLCLNKTLISEKTRKEIKEFLEKENYGNN